MKSHHPRAKKQTRATITRRQAIQGTASLIGGSFAAQFGPLISRAAAATAEDAAPVFLDSHQFETIKRLVDLMIPETDTPGALAAGVPHFIDLMLAEWAADSRRARYIAGLNEIDSVSNSFGADSFLAASSSQQFAILTQLDNHAFADGAGDSFFREFKKLALFGFYSSEAGATIELQYEPLIADYKACAPIDDVGRTWFWLGFSHGL